MATKNHDNRTHKHSIPTDILNDLCSRFIINLPPEDRGNLVRICFQIETAHWFYLDYYCTDESNGVDPCGIRDFAAHIFQHVPQLREHVSNLDEVLSNWRVYKQAVPTYGAILLDTDLTHVLLVQSYYTRASWGFPKGKVNEDEEPWRCAVREVQEETGFDIMRLINKTDYIETVIHDQIVRLYIIGYVPRETKFHPRTRNEIKTCEWFAVADLPSSKKDMTPKIKMGINPNAFFMVMPFIKRMRRWISERNAKVFTNSARRTRHKSMGDLEASTSKKVKAISQGLEREIQDYHQNNPVSKPKYNTKANSQGAETAEAHQNGSFKPRYQQVNQGSTTKPAPNQKKDKKNSKRQLFTPQNVQGTSPVNKEEALKKPEDLNVTPPADEEYNALLNFVAPSWARFKFDRAAILACLD